ncbi:MAG: YihY/virulence factor BrkB family protein [Desulfobacterales bacterium]
MSNLETIYRNIYRFLKTDIWRIPLTHHGGLKGLGIKFIRIMIVCIRGFSEDKLPLRASALTFYSLLSLVPVLAMAFGIAKGFGFQSMLEKRLYENFPGQEELMVRLVEYADSLLQTAKGGLIAGIGVAVLFWMVIKVLGNIEKSFNDIWGIRKARTFGRKFSDYLSMMLIGPLLLIMSGSATVFITAKVNVIVSKIYLFGLVSPVISFLLKALPFVLLWVLFTIIYILMPNTKVRIRSGFYAGLIAGTVYQLSQWIYITFQVGAARYNAIYGSFAALPLFLVWLQISWIVVLMGAEISFAHQNADLFEFEPDVLNISDHKKKLLALSISHHLVKNFISDAPPSTAVDISKELELPIRLTRQILDDLVESKTFSITPADTDQEPGYQPAKDVNKISIQYIVEALENRGSSGIQVRETGETRAIAECLEAIREKIRSAPENRLLRDI